MCDCILIVFLKESCMYFIRTFAVESAKPNKISRSWRQRASHNGNIPATVCLGPYLVLYSSSLNEVIRGYTRVVPNGASSKHTEWDYAAKTRRYYSIRCDVCFSSFLRCHELQIASLTKKLGAVVLVNLLWSSQKRKQRSQLWHGGVFSKSDFTLCIFPASDNSWLKDTVQKMVFP